MVSQGITRESEIKKFNSQVLEKVHSMPWGAIKGQDRVWTEGVGQDLGHMLLLNSTGEVLCGSWAKSSLVNSDQKNQVLVSFLEVPFRRYPRGRYWEAGKSAYHKVVGRIISGTCTHLWFIGGAGVSYRPLHAAWSYQLDAKAAILWSHPVKLSTMGSPWVFVFSKYSFWIHFWWNIKSLAFFPWVSWKSTIPLPSFICTI